MKTVMSHGSDRNGFPHFMLKEIYEQPQAVQRMLDHWLDPSGGLIVPDGFLACQELCRVTKIAIAASGSSRHAGLVGEFMLESMTRALVEVDFASQYCYRDPVVWPDQLTILISQSGTTVDTIAALQEARRKGSKSLAICNVPDSPLTRGADATLLTFAGEEVAVAATKSFTAQLTALFLLSLHIAQCRGTSLENIENLLRELKALPEYMERVLAVDKECQELAAEFAGCKDFLVMGRDIDYPIALEGALKLKETSYIHAEGYPTGEIKHGPGALVSERLPIIVLAARDESNAASLLRYGKTVSNVREFAERGIPILAVVTAGDREVVNDTPYCISIPSVPVLLQPILEVVPLQFLAYHLGALGGHNVDRPRNLSKSVLVE
jgi:glucosamine--fructose-6-phosphate aminotransferase (isomerizing)